KSLLSGAIDAESAPSTFDKGKFKGKSKGKSKGKGKPQSHDKPQMKRDYSRDPNSTTQVKGPCFSFLKFGKCTKENCPYDHYSQNQMELIAKALGPWNKIMRDTSRDSESSKGGSMNRNKSKGRSKGKGKLKGKSAGAQSEPDLLCDVDDKWDPSYFKGDYETNEVCLGSDNDLAGHNTMNHHHQREGSQSRDGKGNNPGWRRKSHASS
ncbi:MAG: hypothetical protein ACKPKO_17055, partial [Candidatus Fonsibacter sp.]